MALSIDWGYERQVTEAAKTGDTRSFTDRDTDRVIHSSAFLRLAGVAQVAHSDGGMVHNRLIHSLKVARIGWDLARYLLETQKEIADSIGGIDPVAVKCAGLAHDLGHPPFGHIAEKVLKTKIDAKNIDGFEGNPQSFRVVTHLAIRDPDYKGLNLCKRSLNAILKYPWTRATGGKRKDKWGCYYSEQSEFEWARKGLELGNERTVEAELMNWADDIAYSTHDIEDYYRAGLIPLDRLLLDDREIKRFTGATFARWKRDERTPKFTEPEYEAAFARVMTVLRTAFSEDLAEQYRGTRRQRAAIHSVTSKFIHHFFHALALRTPTAEKRDFVEIAPAQDQEIAMLKELVWHYVIENPSMAVQEQGQKELIGQLFDCYLTAATSSKYQIFPMRYREQFHECGNDGDAKARIVTDVVAEMTEFQAYQTYSQLTGHSPGSLLDFVHR